MAESSAGRIIFNKPENKKGEVQSLKRSDNYITNRGANYCYNGIHIALCYAMLCYAKSLQLCPTLCDPIDGSPPGFPSLGFSRQEHWSGLPFPSPMRESEVSQSCPTLSDPMDCSLPGSSVHGIFQARVLEWDAIAFSDITL